MPVEGGIENLEHEGMLMAWRRRRRAMPCCNSARPCPSWRLDHRASREQHAADLHKGQRRFDGIVGGRGRKR